MIKIMQSGKEYLVGFDTPKKFYTWQITRDILKAYGLKLELRSRLERIKNG